MLKTLAFDDVKKEVLSTTNFYELLRIIEKYKITKRDLADMNMQNNFFLEGKERVLRKLTMVSIDGKGYTLYEDKATLKCFLARFNPGLKIIMDRQSHGVNQCNFYRVLESSRTEIRVEMCDAFKYSDSGYVAVILRPTNDDTPISVDLKDINLAHKMQMIDGDKLGSLYSGKEQHHIDGNKDNNSFTNLTNIPKFTHSVLSFLDGYTNSTDRLYENLLENTFAMDPMELSDIIREIEKSGIGLKRWEKFKELIIPRLKNSATSEINVYMEAISNGDLTIK